MDSGSDLRKLNLSVNLLYRCDCLLQEGWRSRREETVERGERRRWREERGERREEERALTEELERGGTLDAPSRFFCFYTMASEKT